MFELTDQLAEVLVEELPVGIRVSDWSEVRTYLQARKVDSPADWSRLMKTEPDTWLQLAVRVHAVALNREARRIYDVDSVEEYNAYNQEPEAWIDPKWPLRWDQRMRNMLGDTPGGVWDIFDNDFREDCGIYIRDKFIVPEQHWDSWKQVISIVEDIKDYHERLRRQVYSQAMEEIPNLGKLLDLQG